MFSRYRHHKCKFQMNKKQEKQNRLNIQKEIGDFDQVFDMDGHLVTCNMVVPFFLMETMPSKQQLKAGYKAEIYYASASKNNNFGDGMKMGEAKYEDLTTIYINMEAKEGSRRAFGYLLNIQGVAIKCISQTKDMVGKVVTKDQADYIVIQMRKLIIRSSEILREQKKILEESGINVGHYACSTSFPSKVCQRIRVTRAIRILKTLGEL